MSMVMPTIMAMTTAITTTATIITTTGRDQPTPTPRG